MVGPMNGAPKVTVLLPTNGRDEIIGFAIKSLLNQTLEDFELIVVGDGCRDNTESVVNGFDDPRVIWMPFNKAPGAGYANRNLALRKARGRLIAYAQHDDLFFPDHLERCLRVFEDPRVKFAYSRPLWIDDAGLVIPSYVNLRLPGPQKSFLHQMNVLPSSNVVHLRSCFDNAGYWPDEDIPSGDWDLWKRIIKAYGWGCMRLERHPTCLHFRACWRDPKRWAPPPVPYLAAVASAGGYWPDQLRLDLKLVEREPQAQVYDLMRTSPKEFMQEIRKGVSALQDQLAWTAGLDRNFVD